MLIPESVRTHVQDGSIRRAARELLAMPNDRILEGLDWKDLPRFYRAQLAARQLAAEWGAFGCEAWDAVWGGLLDHWTALSPDEQSNGKREADLHLDSLLDTNDDSLWFGRLFTSGAYTFYATVAAVPSAGMRVKVSCESGSRMIGFQELAPAHDDVRNWSPPLSAPLDAEEFDPAPLRQLASRAVEIADARCRPKRSVAIREPAAAPPQDVSI